MSDFVLESIKARDHFLIQDFMFTVQTGSRYPLSTPQTTPSSAGTGLLARSSLPESGQRTDVPTDRSSPAAVPPSPTQSVPDALVEVATVLHQASALALPVPTTVERPASALPVTPPLSRKRERHVVFGEGLVFKSGKVESPQPDTSPVPLLPVNPTGAQVPALALATVLPLAPPSVPVDGQLPDPKAERPALPDIRLPFEVGSGMPPARQLRIDRDDKTDKTGAPRARTALSTVRVRGYQQSISSSRREMRELMEELADNPDGDSKRAVRVKVVVASVMQQPSKYSRLLNFETRIRVPG